MDPIIVHFSANYNILALHDEIAKRLSNTGGDGALVKELEAVEDALACVSTVSEMQRLKVRKASIEKQLNKISSNQRLLTYTREVKDYLVMYSSLPAARTSSDGAKRIGVVGSYLDIASKYVTLEVLNKSAAQVDMTCAGCGTDLSAVTPSSRGARMCACGVELLGAKPVITAPREYEVWVNFLKTFKRHLGDITVSNISSVVNDLDKHAVANDEPTGDYYRNLPLDKYGMKEGTSPSDLDYKLTRSGHTSCLDGYMYIGHVYYGWTLHTYLGCRVPEMEQNFKAKQDEWDKMTVNEREGSSSISNQYRLCRELQHIGFKCRLRDFNVSCNKNTTQRYDRVYGLMCKRAGFTFPHFDENNY